MSFCWWTPDGQEGWKAEAVDRRVALTQDGLIHDSPAGHAAAAVVARVGASPTARWAVLGDPARVAVNGLPLRLGIRALADRDEVRVSDPRDGTARRFFFTTEQLVAVDRFPDGAAAVCPRCKDPLVAGRPAIRCPQCGVWHHQDDESGRPCWTYGERCAACHNQPTALDAGFRWTPEELSP